MVTKLPSSSGKTAIILVAAGRGRRAGTGTPKQYRNIMGVPVLGRTLSALNAALPDTVIVPVIHPDDEDMFEACSAGYSNIASPVFGGATRQQSVCNALNALAALNEPPEWVLIHDAARPFLAVEVTDALMLSLERGTVALPALPLVDTIVRKPVDGASAPVDRTDLFAVQTPQAFPFKEILVAHRQAEGQTYTDDASLFEAMGGKVAYVQGGESNFKITTPADFKKAERLVQAQLNDIRTGSGFDVHRFEAGDHVWLGGVKIPFNQSLKGHSDADVALHALTDALLAAIADGDIGTHFPPSDPEWRGAASDHFLAFASDRVRALGGAINHLTVTLICEKPKIGPHAAAMRARIAEIAQIEVSRVSVQATTTEMLGFTGRGEGIAAQATATVALPASASTPDRGA